MSAHTPGPWYWDAKVWDYDKAQDAPWLVKNETETVLTGHINCESEANARLIAAAPELLESLKLMDEAYCNACNASNACSAMSQKDWVHGRKAMVAARQAMAKATGAAA